MYLPTNVSRHEIAAELPMSVNMVSTPIRSIYAKLQVGGPPLSRPVTGGTRDAVTVTRQLETNFSLQAAIRPGDRRRAQRLCKHISAARTSDAWSRLMPGRAGSRRVTPGHAGTPGRRASLGLRRRRARAGDGVPGWASGPLRIRAPQTTAPPAKIPAVHQNAVV